MKKVLSLFIFCFVILSAHATEYSCQYQENNTYYSGKYVLNATANEHCKTWCKSDFWIEKGKCDECLNQDYPRILKAFRSGSCQKIMPPIIYNNVEGCKCKVTKLEDGTIYDTSCGGGSSCNIKKAMAKLKWMLMD